VTIIKSSFDKEVGAQCPASFFFAYTSAHLLHRFNQSFITSQAKNPTQSKGMTDYDEITIFTEK
jgi:hypothetical protein